MADMDSQVYSLGYKKGIKKLYGFAGLFIRKE